MKRMQLTDFLKFQFQTDIHRHEEMKYVKFVHGILISAIEARASDVHFEPLSSGCCQLSYRIHQSLVHQMILGRRITSKIYIRLKYLAKVNLTENRRVQEGSFSFTYQDREISFRYSAVPTKFGQKIVLRILDPINYFRPLKSLGFLDEDYRLIQKMIQKKDGLILFTGATGQGKSTTVFSALGEINRVSNCVISIEDPIEINYPNITQFEVCEPELDFSTLLQMSLRQDPDIIFLGEIRDQKSAFTALQASFTGHLVFSTIHAANVFTVPRRLKSFGLDEQMIEESLRLIVSQRLVRLKCQKCSEYSNSVCPHCAGRGCSGQTGIFELLPCSPDLLMQLKDMTSAQIRAAAQKKGWHSFESQIQKLFEEGRISEEEFQRQMQRC